ncbi:MAG: 50S ribosomal protein L11 [Candidatus Diapherotrites archaeon]|nr:50S ribosomal protein L11 [Candidatus Diapherotrites archaeon]
MADISVLVDAGKATAAAPLGPALGPLGVNIGEIVAKINEKTKDYTGMKVPVKISIDSKKNFEIVVGSPPTSALIKKELGIQKGSGNPKEPVSNISIEQVVKIVKMKIDNSGASTVKGVAREIIGVCDSMGITVEGKPAREMQKDIAAGKFDSKLQ